MKMTFFQKLKRFMSRLAKEFKKLPRRTKRNIFLVLAGILAVIILLIVIASACSAASSRRAAEEQEREQQASIAAYEQSQATTAPVNQISHMIQGVPVISQSDLRAGCETYACTMLLQYMGFDIDEHDFADNYLICRDISYDDDGTRYGPDMYSAFAGTVYNGYGIYAPAMAKSMDLYFEAQNSPKRAKPLKNVTLAQLCEDYTKNDIGVMVWATTDMQEPVEDQSVWVVNYTDENAVTHEGDTFSWPGHEHCLVLIGYDETKYYFSDSVAGEVSSWDKALCEQRFQQLGSQAIVVL